MDSTFHSLDKSIVDPCVMANVRDTDSQAVENPGVTLQSVFHSHKPASGRIVP